MNWIMVILPLAMQIAAWLMKALEDGKLDEKDIQDLVNRVAGGLGYGKN